MAATNLEEVLQSAGNVVELLRNQQTGPNVYPGVPAEYSNWRDEQQAWQQTCVLFDQSFHMAELAVEGRDALALLSGLGVHYELGEGHPLLGRRMPDLDLVTLQVLEAALTDYPGCVLMVTHDRFFLDKIATALFVFEGDGVVHRHEGGFELYRRLRERKEAEAAAEKAMQIATESAEHAQDLSDSMGREGEPFPPYDPRDTTSVCLAPSTCVRDLNFQPCGVFT